MLEEGGGTLAGERGGGVQVDLPLDLGSLRQRPRNPARAELGGKSVLQMGKPRLGELK